MAGLLKHSGGNLTKEKVAEMTKWNSGPKIRLSETPGNSSFGKEALGFYDRYGTKDIIINSQLAEQLEKASDQERQLALVAIYKTILHESTHYGDYLDGNGMLNSEMDYIEAGNAFDDDVFWGSNNGGRHAVFSDMVGISTISRVKEWGNWISNERPDTWKQLIPQLPTQFKPMPPPVSPLPLPKPNPQPCGCMPNPRH